MKSFLTAMSIFLVLIIGGVVFNMCLNGVAKTMLENAEGIGELIEREKFSEAKKRAEELSDYVDGKKSLLSSILDHSNIDEIEKEISGLLAYSERENKTESSASIKKLTHMFEHLPENYALEFQNIL